MEALEELSRRVEEQLACWRDLEAKDLAASNEMVRKENIPPLWVDAAPGTKCKSKVNGRSS